MINFSLKIQSFMLIKIKLQIVLKIQSVARVHMKSELTTLASVMISYINSCILFICYLNFVYYSLSLYTCTEASTPKIHVPKKSIIIYSKKLQ